MALSGISRRKQRRRQSGLSIVRGRESQGPDVWSKCSVGASGAAGS